MAAPKPMQYPLTKQAIIDRQWDWFFQCGKPEGFDEGLEKCTYAAGCSVGILLPEDMSLREDCSVTEHLANDDQFRGLFAEGFQDEGFLQRLQEMHDYAAHRANCDEDTALGSFHLLFYDELKELAEEHGCKLPKPTAGWDYGNRLPAVGQR